jgi:formyltetrahydrofolate deformylase
MEEKKYILKLICRDDFGIVAAVSKTLSEHGAFIIESSQFGDAVSKLFFMRLLFSIPEYESVTLHEILKPTIKRYTMTARLTSHNTKPKTLIMASKESHCLNDILYRTFAQSLPLDIACIVSNHEYLYAMAQWYNIPYFYIPITPQNKDKAESRLRELLERFAIDLVVLARYMQVLSPSLCADLLGRAINIHHSFLPSFKGARPYHQAFAHGVKIIGATAHYITPDLDEGPIIHQETLRVTHEHSPERLIALGRDAECRALSQALLLHAEERVLLNGNKTVVFT